MALEDDFNVQCVAEITDFTYVISKERTKCWVAIPVPKG